MPWLETDPMDQRLRFIRDDQSDLYDRTELCARYGISRKTGYTRRPTARRQPSRSPHLTAQAATEDREEVRQNSQNSHVRHVSLRRPTALHRQRPRPSPHRTGRDRRWHLVRLLQHRAARQARRTRPHPARLTSPDASPPRCYPCSRSHLLPMFPVAHRGPGDPLRTWSSRRSRGCTGSTRRGSSSGSGTFPPPSSRPSTIRRPLRRPCKPWPEAPTNWVSCGTGAVQDERRGVP
jgi:hypothetical protein